MAEVSFGDKLGDTKGHRKRYKRASYSRRLAAMMWVTTACAVVTVTFFIGILIAIIYI